jgi:hypothetical protein
MLSPGSARGTSTGLCRAVLGHPGRAVMVGRHLGKLNRLDSPSCHMYKRPSHHPCCLCPPSARPNWPFGTYLENPAFRRGNGKEAGHGRVARAAVVLRWPSGERGGQMNTLLPVFLDIFLFSKRRCGPVGRVRYGHRHEVWVPDGHCRSDMLRGIAHGMTWIHHGSAAVSTLPATFASFINILSHLRIYL